MAKSSYFYQDFVLSKEDKYPVYVIKLKKFLLNLQNVMVIEEFIQL